MDGSSRPDWPPSQAINRERYAEEVFGGFTRWDATGTVAQPWAHDDEVTTPAYSPEAASVLLTEAGWIDYDGDGVREDVNGWQLRPVAIVRDDSRPELAAVMARVARDLAAVGIALSVEVLPPDAFDERWITRRDYDLIAYAYDQLPGFTDFDLYGRHGTSEITRRAGIRAAMRTPRRTPRSTNSSAPSPSSVR